LAYFDQVWYCNAGDQSTTGYYAVTKWATGATIAAGALRRQLATPTIGNERVFVCIVGGTTHATTEPTWVLTRGAKTTDNTVTWQECTGASAVNGDLTNTPTWAQVRAINVVMTLGVIIQRNSGASYQICSTAGNIGTSEPAFSNTAGVTTSDGTATWTSLGPVGNFTGGQAPHARLLNACTTNWFAAGNTIWVGDNHAESQATAITIAPAAGVATLGKILCHNHSGSYPPTSSDLTTGATISTTAAANITFNPSSGAFYFYGITFQVAVGASSGVGFFILAPVAAFYSFDNCVFKLANTVAAGNTIQLNTTSAGIILWNNCTVSFGHVNNYIDVGTCSFIWQNTGPVLVSGSAVPGSLLSMSSVGRLSSITLEALDLSQITGNLIGTSSISEMTNCLVKDCKLNASMTIAAAQSFGQIIQFVRSDSSATGYKSARYLYEGAETTETSITRVGGAVDPAGQAQSRKIITSANSQWLRPFKAEPFAIWNPTTGSNVTVTVYGTINAGAVPNNDDIWIEVEYLGASGSPLGTIVTTTKASILAANAAVSSDSSTWNVPTFTSWNPSDLTGITLSNSNLTATGTGVASGVRALNGWSTGKYYWEMTIGTWTNNATGPMLGPATSIFSGVIWANVSKLGQVVINNSVTGPGLGARSSGDTIGIAVDIGAKLIWFRVAPSGNWNGSGTANPATGAGGFDITPISTGPLFPAFYANIASDAATANFGASAFSGSVPSGFTAGFPSTWLPFKLTITLSSPQPQFPGYLYARVRAAKPSTTYYIDPKIGLS
jgi:hypothetical protein